MPSSAPVAGATPRPPQLSEAPPALPRPAGSSAAARAKPTAGRPPQAPSGPASPHASPAGRGRASHVAKPTTAAPPAAATKAGSAVKPGTAPGATAAPKVVAGYAASASSGDWAFLSEKGLSIEEKLARFAAVAMAKIDRDLEAKMAQYKADFGGSSSSSAQKSGGLSLFGMLESAVPGLSELTKLFGESAFKKAASALGGPVLAAAATALGMPELAPVALKYGGQLTALAFTEVGGTKSTAASSSPSSSSAGAPDEKVAMLELQLLVEKQQRLFTAISNTLKVAHDTQMAAVHNLR